MLINQTHVQQKNSQAHHQKSRDIHQLQSGRQTRRNYTPGTIYVLNDGLRRNTRRLVDGPVTKKIPICLQGKLTNINRTISDPSTRHLLVWKDILYILHAIYIRWRICFWIQEWHRKRDHPPFQSLHSVWPRNAHWHRKTPRGFNACFPAPRFL